MSVLTYKLHRIYNAPLPGSTKPSACTMDAVLKFDNIESPHCVYNEHVALRIAQLMGAPVASGALTVAFDSQAYASMKLGAAGISLLPLASSRFSQAAEKYPQESAALLVYDLFIGNWDRKDNFTATLVSPHIRMFAGFDHGNALLNVKKEPKHSLKWLREHQYVLGVHPFYKRVKKGNVERWLTIVESIPDDSIISCCDMGGDFRSVTVRTQKALAKALCQRKRGLRQLITDHEGKIFGKCK